MSQTDIEHTATPADRVPVHQDVDRLSEYVVDRLFGSIIGADERELDYAVQGRHELLHLTDWDGIVGADPGCGLVFLVEEVVPILGRDHNHIGWSSWLFGMFVVRAVGFYVTHRSTDYV
ncbi:hypothetical protein E6P09_15740 (plasmid) [Haloferax mediterranei ATCC 33500]|uniref:Uncharacterized protein n=1 Tax=Haloferax mediterranei (strain ATCC 33500 / DSM 1411 / JCM 8866 / NBRC 14739 / NCIMB 2177 / R-4) TaxID=523841 RepID=I3RBF6_HALMT|nr:hypothetical protein HFX_6448 [Haloferax mediterranei ATCC 33500]AHZ24385.1 hypothetical protein BM92_15815 [Haloferax mediterranei ATCC 33500]ELZ97124.1 hypothetical protein C439_17418 [Haloferax mediterranei ATCC 33500]QCQ76786.1 hypothetical protein E6P09_15740 [Haloferax mediterranei ATCC 33500]